MTGKPEGKKVQLSGLRAMKYEGLEERTLRAGANTPSAGHWALGAGPWVLGPGLAPGPCPRRDGGVKGRQDQFREGSVIDRGLLTEANDQTWTLGSQV